MLDNTQTPRRTAEQWQAIVDQQIASGLSGAAFCKSEGIKYQSFMNWRLKLTTSKVPVPTKANFIELTKPGQSNEERPSEWLLELDLAPGVQLRIAR